jgi:hypothetical protein
MMKRNAAWKGLPVTLLKGGVSRRVHFRGVGLVRHGAEREAQIAQLLATFPDALEDGVFGLMNGYFQAVADGLSRRSPF